MFQFELLATDPSCSARRGRLLTPHGTIETPIFMPVGTHGALKAMTPAQVEETEAQIILANTYHLHLKPGEALVKKAGGLHRFMNWDKPILTDSGGFQVFSLPKKRIGEHGVHFRHEITGEEIFLGPQEAMQIENDLGADIIMAFDECIPYPATHDYSAKSIKKTLRWAESCLKYHSREDQALFGIVQGSVYDDLRRECAEQMTAMDFPGYAVGGVSVGEGLELLKKVVEYTAPFLPENKPRYLMGVGLPEDILESIERGMDMFDCVIPTRYARSATLFTSRGKIRLTNRNFRRDFFPVDPACDCYCCRNFSRAYLHHLFNANEILSATLSAIHNVRFYLNMVAGARKAIEAGEYLEFKKEFLGNYLSETKGSGTKSKKRKNP
ncbi:MAG: tRNA guanosine(34) transglycosylase Tgt [Desulfuromonadales bacterium]|nr:tRNA guanosine(34) transglycosylase Tgt [Desulfuromonadales bacterium]